MSELQSWVETERRRLAEQRNLLLRQMYMELGRLNGQIEAFDVLLGRMAMLTPDAPLSGVETPPVALGADFMEVPDVPQNGSTS